jgi:hypothetical protein
VTGAVRRAIGLALGAGAAIGVACTTVGTDPKHVEIVELEPPAFPSIVAGDFLRDSLGQKAPLRPHAFNAQGDTIPDEPFGYVSPDTTVTIDATGVVTAKNNVDVQAHLYATAAGLQSDVRTVDIVPSPDSLVPKNALDSIPYVRPNPSRSNVSPALTVTLWGTRPDGTAGTVKSYVVSFQLLFHKRLLSPTDTSAAYLLDAPSLTSRKQTWLDTTDASGVAGRQVFVNIDSVTKAVDTIFVIATIHPRPKALARSKDTLTVVLRPLTP